MKTELSLILKIIDSVLELVFKYLDKQRQAEIEENIDEIHKNPSDWLNSRYGTKRVRNDQKSDGKRSGSSNDSKADG